MTFTVSPWLVWAGASLALFGVWFVLSAVGDGLRQLWGWVRRDRVAPLIEDDLEYCYPDCLPDCRNCLAELPPERSWEQMTSHQLPLEPGAADHFLRPPGYLAAVRERRVPSWEVDQRQHYAAMGFDFPSGLMARVRELTP